jgi:predicted metal-dependent phosphoesterase TrpH
MKISLHIHSEYSVDARQTVQSIVGESKRLGYDAIAITDHNTVAGSLAAAALPQDAVKIIPGAEFSTEKGHILALFIDGQIEKSVRRNGPVFVFDELVTKVRAQDGLLFLAHPLQSAADQDPAFIADLDGYELVNARIDAGFRVRQAKRLSEALRERFPDKCRIGGSDAHTRAELKSVYMTSDRTDPRAAVLNPDSIHCRPSSAAGIRITNIVYNRNKGAGYCLRQAAAAALGLPVDLCRKVRGDTNEVIRVRAEG